MLSPLLLFLTGQFLTPQEWKSSNLFPLSVIKLLLRELYQDRMNEHDWWVLENTGSYTPYVYFAIFNATEFDREKSFNPYIYRNRSLTDDHAISYALHNMVTHRVSDIDVRNMVNLLEHTKIFIRKPYGFKRCKENGKDFIIITKHMRGQPSQLVGVYFISYGHLVCHRCLDRFKVMGIMSREVSGEMVDFHAETALM